MDRNAGYLALFLLQQTDGELTALQRRRRKLGEDLKTLEARRAAADAALERLRQANQRAQVDAAARNTEMETELAKLEQHKERLKTAQDAKTYTALEKQIAASEAMAGRLEDEALALMMEAEAAEAALEKGKAERERFEEETYRPERVGISESARELDEEQRKREAEREEREKAVPENLTQKYDRWRKTRQSSMIAKALQKKEKSARGEMSVVYACSECLMNIPPQIVLEARAKPTDQNCPSCSRILWAPDEAGDSDAP